MNTIELKIIEYLKLNVTETSTHLNNVRETTKEFMQYLKKKGHYDFNDDYIKKVTNASILHDIGKASIPELILYKKGTLNENERMIIETHPLTGTYLFSKVLLKMKMKQTKEEQGITKNIILYHHERWDGIGYPYGLKEENIPFESRIISIVDVYDALTSERSYKKAWKQDKALFFIEEQKGRMFDPTLANYFIEMFKEKEKKTIKTKEPAINR